MLRRPSHHANGRRSLRGVVLTLPLLVLLITLSSCTSIRPVYKIGLIAPFEGLYRETGYAALDAMRQAIDDCAPAHVDVIPLALDDSAQPHAAARSAHKLHADTAVAAVIGPYSLDTMIAAGPQLSRFASAWYAPTAIDETNGFANEPDRPQWIADLVVRAADAAASEGASALHVGGLPPALTEGVQSEVAAASTVIPVRFVPDASDYGDYRAEDALLWLGQPHEAARVAARLHAVEPGAALWLGPEADSPVFPAHAEAAGSAYWLTWTTPLYNPAVQPAPGLLTAQLTYAATCEALATLSGSETAPAGADAPSLHSAVFRIEEEEVHELFVQP